MADTPKKANPTLVGPTTAKRSGKGVGYSQMAVGKGFATMESRPGHSQKKNCKVDK